MSESLKTQMYHALRAVQKAWELDSEYGFYEMEAAFYDHVMPALWWYQWERDAARREVTR